MIDDVKNDFFEPDDTLVVVKPIGIKQNDNYQIKNRIVKIENNSYSQEFYEDELNFIFFLFDNTHKLQKDLLNSDNLGFVKYEGFWHNFTLNFNNKQFLKIIYEDEVILQKYMEIVDNFCLFMKQLSEYLNDIKDESETNNVEELKMITFTFSKIIEFDNKLKEKIDLTTYDETLSIIKHSISPILKIDINKILDFTFMKYGQCILKFDGKFCYADEYSNILFGSNKLIGDNFFEKITKSSQFKIKKFFKNVLEKSTEASSLDDDFSDGSFGSSRKSKRDQKILKYSIIKNRNFNIKDSLNFDYLGNFWINVLNNTITLTSRFRIVVVSNEPRVLLETRLSKTRQYKDHNYYHDYI